MKDPVDARRWDRDHHEPALLQKSSAFVAPRRKPLDGHVFQNSEQRDRVECAIGGGELPRGEAIGDESDASRLAGAKERWINADSLLDGSTSGNEERTIVAPDVQNDSTDGNVAQGSSDPDVADGCVKRSEGRPLDG